MRIVLCGTAGVGKTTLLGKINETYNFPIINELVRSVAVDMGYNSIREILDAGKGVVEEFQITSFMRQLKQQTVFGNHYISDRSCYDIIAYSQLYGLDKKLVKQMKEIADRHIRYDLMFYCPIPAEERKEDLDDGFRITHSREELDDILFRLVMDNPNKIVVLSRQRNEWEGLCKEIIDCVRRK